MVRRGCLSKADKTIQMDCKSTEKCFLCDDEILCNYRPMKKIDTANQTPQTVPQDLTYSMEDLIAPNSGNGSAQIILNLSILIASAFIVPFIS